MKRWSSFHPLYAGKRFNGKPNSLTHLDMHFRWFSLNRPLGQFSLVVAISTRRMELSNYGQLSCYCRIKPTSQAFWAVCSLGVGWQVKQRFTSFWFQAWVWHQYSHLASPGSPPAVFTGRIQADCRCPWLQQGIRPSIVQHSVWETTNRQKDASNCSTCSSLLLWKQEGMGLLGYTLHQQNFWYQQRNKAGLGGEPNILVGLPGSWIYDNTE